MPIIKKGGTVKQADFIIIGAGIIGVNIARELKRRFTDASIIILEKEPEAGLHASGRNSGVLHAGFYYTQDSLKAKFSKQGNELLTQFCLDKNIPINRCGKLIVARNENDLPGLYELLKRGNQNGISLNLISAKEAAEIEPRVKTFEKALFSPTTSSVPPKIVMQHMLKEAEAEGISIQYDIQYLGKKNHRIVTNKGHYSCGYFINSAGLYADKIAKDFGFSNDYCILPFKGIYLYASTPQEKLKTHIYPVPILKNPFLGVHFTVGVEGTVKIGPTAIPALWREQYDFISHFNFKEMAEILLREIGLFFNAGFDFRKLAWNEIKKYNRHHLIKHAAELVSGVESKNYKQWGKPGIRAQLLNKKTRQLEMDFILEGDKNSFHVLNAVSPAFTCSIPFASYVVDKINAFIH